VPRPDQSPLQHLYLYFVHNCCGGYAPRGGIKTAINIMFAAPNGINQLEINIYYNIRQYNMLNSRVRAWARRIGGCGVYDILIYVHTHTHTHTRLKTLKV